MKTLYFTVLLVLLCFACMSRDGSNDTTAYQSVSESFFNQSMGRFKSSDFKRLNRRLFCLPSGLDTIITKNKRLYVAGKIQHPVPFLNNDAKFLVFYLKNDKHLEGYKEFDKYQNGKFYFNNIISLFQLQNDSTYLMLNYLSKPINQGMCGLDYVDIVYNLKNKHLYLKQFGGNDFGKWCSEFEFEFDDISKKWMHYRSNLYTASYKCCPEYKTEKLVWSKKPLKRLCIEDVNYTDYFKYQELETLML